MRHPVTSGHLFDGHEFGRLGPICPLAAGLGVEDVEAGRQFL